MWGLVFGVVLQFFTTLKTELSKYIQEKKILLKNLSVNLLLLVLNQTFKNILQQLVRSSLRNIRC